MTRSLGIALTDLKLDRAFVVYPGATRLSKPPVFRRPG